MPNSSLPMVAIVGRPNVGKSSLFNIIMRRRISIVHEEAGVTRDTIMARCHWGDRDFLLVDTGGLGVLVREKNVPQFDALIREQVLAVAQEAALLILVVDIRAGITPQDIEVANYLRTTGCPVILAVNKADNEKFEETAEALFKPLGFKSVVPVSCIQKTGIEPLLEECLVKLPAVIAEPEPETELRLAVIGRPNVGKSSLVNALIGEQRVMVSDIAGTTRDAVDIPLQLEADNGELIPVTLIDTAGLRKKKSMDSMVEYFSVLRTEKALERADVILFVLDSPNAGTTLDRKIARMITEKGKPCLIIANKWDLMEKQAVKRKEFFDFIRSNLTFMAHAPIIPVSALNRERIETIAQRLVELRKHMKVAIPTAVFNRFLQDVLMRTPPPTVNGKRLKIYYGTMVSTPPPSFVLFVNNPANAADHYIQFIENKIRDAFFPETGLPILLSLRERKDADTSEQKGTRAAAIGTRKTKEAQFQRKKRYRERQRGYRDR